LRLSRTNKTMSASKKQKQEAEKVSVEDESDDEEVTQEATKGRKVIVILDMAQLETVKTKKGDFQLLNCDDHISIMKRNNKDPSLYRPDILHQELMAVLDSPLNKAGLVQVYIKTARNVLVEVNPKTRIPRTFKRFSGLMVQLLHRLKIRSADGDDTLLKVIKNPLSRHLPAGLVCFGMSQQSELHNPMQFASTLPDNTPIGFVIGAFASGSIDPNDHPYMTRGVSISEYPLSGVVAINRLIGAIENHWGVV